MISVKLHKKYRNIRSVKKVVLLSTYVNMFIPNSRDFAITEINENGDPVNLQYFGVQGFDCADAAKMKPGQTIYKYIYEEHLVVIVDIFVPTCDTVMAEGWFSSFSVKTPSSLVTTDIRPAEILTCRRGAPDLSSTTVPLTSTC